MSEILSIRAGITKGPRLAFHIFTVINRDVEHRVLVSVVIRLVISGVSGRDFFHFQQNIEQIKV